jgi:hypothetical protein
MDSVCLTRGDVGCVLDSVRNAQDGDPIVPLSRYANEDAVCTLPAYERDNPAAVSGMDVDIKGVVYTQPSVCGKF